MWRSPEALVGQRVGHYELESVLGKGGQGAVFVARDLRENPPARLVALKLPLDDADPQRFLREASILQRLARDEGPIVRWLESGHDPDLDLDFLVTELLVGERLDVRMAGGLMSPGDAIEVGLQVCEALVQAHALGVVHRDLKPLNIFLRGGSPGGVKVLDFGIARNVHETRMTASGNILGTLGYLSPEQAGATRSVDHRTDLWSLGVVLFECLTGTLPFVAASVPGVLMGILHKDAVAVQSRRPDVPRELAAVIARCLKKSPDDRYASAAEMSAALRTARARLGAAPSAPPPAPPRPPVDPHGDTEGIGAEDRTIDRRLTSVVFLREVDDAAWVRARAAALRGRVIALATGDPLVVFGFERWSGDEPRCAVEFAVEVAGVARSVGVATGHAERGGERISGRCVDEAVALTEALTAGVHLDEQTAALVESRFCVVRSTGAAASVDLASPRRDAELPNAAESTPFVGRAMEMTVLLQSANPARTRPSPASVLVLGAVGMGKSRLRREALRAQRQKDVRGTILHATATDSTRDVPFGVLHDLLSGHPALLPTLLALDSRSEAPDVVLDKVRQEVEQGLRSLGKEGGVLLAIDDAQWLDGPTRDVLGAAVGSLRGVPLTVWLFARAEARESLASAMPRATVHELSPLEPDDAETLLLALAGKMVPQLLERAGGLPLFIEELVRFYRDHGDKALTGGLPISVEAAYQVLLDGLDPRELDFLKRAAVFGGTVALEAAVALGADPAALPVLEREDLLRVEHEPRFLDTTEFTFVSGLLQEVVVHRWTETQRADHDRGAALWLERRPEATPAEVARHWDRAGEPSRAAPFFVLAAESASQVGDTGTAMAMAERALASTTEPDLRWRALRAQDRVLQLAGRRDAHRQVLQRLADAASSEALPRQLENAWRQCYFSRTTGDFLTARSWGGIAESLEVLVDDPALRASLQDELALLCADEGRLDEAERHAGAGHALAEQCADPWTVARALSTRGYVANEREDVAAALSFFERAAETYAACGDRRREAQSTLNAAVAFIRFGRVAEAVTRLDAAIAMAGRVGNTRSVATATQNRATCRRMLGDAEAARADVLESGRQAEAIGHVRLAAAVAVERAHLALSPAAAPDERAAALASLDRASGHALSPSLTASVLAARLRLLRRLDRPLAGDALTVRGMLAELASQPEARAEVAIALWETSGSDDDAALARRALDATVERVAAGGDGSVVREALATRLSVPPGLR